MPDESKTTTKGRIRRTIWVDERVWAAFGEFKAGITGRKGESAVALALAGLGYSALHGCPAGGFVWADAGGSSGARTGLHSGDRDEEVWWAYHRLIAWRRVGAGSG
jgi:hypothetical protein